MVYNTDVFVVMTTSKIEAGVDRMQPAQTSDFPTICLSFLICETTIIGQDGSLSMIRLVDSALIDPPDIPQEAELPLLNLSQLKLVAVLKAPKGRKLSVELRSRLSGAEPRIFATGRLETFESADYPTTHNVSPLSVVWEGNGLYWIELYIDSQLLAKTPFRLTVRKPEQLISEEGGE